ncbi:hypothetical protein Rcae01_04744 [Novipirellula caenicola]|uniref:ASPIC/UnbV domain-containing protein n=2 Tax=Novipirellula caenicola TaxID=1536901 RepID=A0ABP9VXC9_9BACT
MLGEKRQPDELRWRHFVGVLVFLLAFCGCQPSENTPLASSTTDSQPVNVELERETMKQQLTQVANLIHNGRLDDAEKILTAVQIQSPNDLYAGTLRVLLLCEQNQVQEAVYALDELALSHPDNAALLRVQAAELLFEDGNDLAAIQRFDSLLQQHSDFVEARRRFAQQLNQRGFRSEANRQLKILSNQAPLELAELRALCFPHHVGVDIAEKPDIHDAQQVRSLGVLNVARALRSQGDIRESLQLLDSRDDLWQQHAAVETLYGWTLAESQQQDRLARWLGGRSEQWELYSEYWLAAGHAVIRQSPDAAAACFAAAIRLEPNSVEAHNAMVQSLQLAGDQERAEAFRERVRMVQHVQQLVRRMINSKQIDPRDYSEMSAIMQAMGRPLESVLWQELMFTKLAPGSEQLNELAEYKPKLLAQRPGGLDMTRLLCGFTPVNSAVVETVLASLEQQSLTVPTTSMQRGLSNAMAKAKPAPPVFANVASDVGLRFAYQNAAPPVERHFQIFQAYGSGVACLDFDADGLIDLYFGQAACNPPEGTSELPNGLFRNRGAQFENVISASAADDRHYTTGVTAGDWNQDGFPDLALANLGPNRLLVNQGDGTFRVQNVAPMWDEPEYTTSLAIADVSGDHLPDLVAVNYIDDSEIYRPIEYDAKGKPIRLPGPLHFQPGLDRYFETTPVGGFQAKTFGSSASETASSGLGLLVSDIDGDGGIDVFVANDQRANQLWMHRETAATSETTATEQQWSDVAVAKGVAYGQGGMPMACMGIAAADFDGNLLMDLHITNFENQWSNLLMQNASGVFSDLVVAYGLDALTRNRLGFGTQAIDYDNNSTWDLVTGNGHIEDFSERGVDFEMRSQLFVRSGSQFREATVDGDDDYWQTGHLSRGMARCDWNRDGLVDVVVTDLKQNVALLENRTGSTGHFLQLELTGTRSERDAIGAKVTIRCNDQTWAATVQTGDGYLSRNENVLCFGLGDHQQVDAVEIVWPSGQTQSFEQLTVDCRLLIIENEAALWKRW